jgi:hypothetical protein
VLRPCVTAGVKQSDDLSATGVERRDITPFVPIAQCAGVSEVLHDRLSLMLPTDDVVYLVIESSVRFVNTAILTAAQCTLGH